jgi:hypothetical protein
VKRFAAAIVLLSIGLPTLAQDKFLTVEQTAGPFADPTQKMRLLIRPSALVVAPEQQGFYHKDYHPGLEIQMRQITSIEYLPENRYRSCLLTISWEDRGVEQQDEFTVSKSKCAETIGILRPLVPGRWVDLDK